MTWLSRWDAELFAFLVLSALALMAVLAYLGLCWSLRRPAARPCGKDER